MLFGILEGKIVVMKKLKSIVLTTMLPVTLSHSITLKPINEARKIRSFSLQPIKNNLSITWTPYSYLSSFSINSLEDKKLYMSINYFDYDLKLFYYKINNPFTQT